MTYTVKRICLLFTRADRFYLLKWDGILYMDQKVCLNLVKKRPIVCCCTHEQKINFEGFTQNGCY